jgi:hypothetical protein
MAEPGLAVSRGRDRKRTGLDSFEPVKRLRGEAGAWPFYQGSLRGIKGSPRSTS